MNEEQGFPSDGYQGSESFHDWADGLSETETLLQYDLSCLVDGELDEAAAARVMIQMEESPECQSFFDDARRYVRLHKDLSDPERLEARLAMLSGAMLSSIPGAADVAAEAERVDLHHRLATIFYQLGKAYVLSAVDPESFRARVFEAAVPVEQVKTSGRGFVDGVIVGGRDRTGLDWRHARHMLNGRLEQIEDPLDKGRRLLLQALETDSSHEEARIYLAFVYTHEGKILKASELYREVFDTALTESNRGHAANMLGKLYADEGDFRKATAYWRWLNMSGLPDVEDRFWLVRFNLGLAYANTGDQERSLDYFRRLIDAHPGRMAEIAQAFADNVPLQKAIESQAGFPEALMRRCPELFESTATQGD